MQVRGSWACIAALAATVGGCGPPLGEYRVDEVEVVDWDALRRAGPNMGYTQRSEFLLRIRFSSPTDLETASGGSGSGLYIDADFCPLRDENRLIAFGPFYGDRSPYGDVRERQVHNPDGGTVTVVDLEVRHPPQDARTGRFLYTMYIVPYAEADDRRHFARAAYDLRRDGGDICLRIDHPGYYVTPSRSETFRLNRSAVVRALEGRPRR